MKAPKPYLLISFPIWCQQHVRSKSWRILEARRGLLFGRPWHEKPFAMDSLSWFPPKVLCKFPKETYGKIEFLGAMDLRTGLAGVQKAGGLDARHGICSKINPRWHTQGLKIHEENNYHVSNNLKVWRWFSLYICSNWGFLLQVVTWCRPWSIFGAGQDLKNSDGSFVESEYLPSHSHVDTEWHRKSPKQTMIPQDLTCRIPQKAVLTERERERPHCEWCFQKGRNLQS